MEMRLKFITYNDIMFFNNAGGPGLMTLIEIYLFLSIEQLHSKREKKKHSCSIGV